MIPIKRGAKDTIGTVKLKIANKMTPPCLKKRKANKQTDRQRIGFFQSFCTF